MHNGETVVTYQERGVCFGHVHTAIEEATLLIPKSRPSSSKAGKALACWKIETVTFRRDTRGKLLYILGSGFLGCTAVLCNFVI